MSFKSVKNAKEVKKRALRITLILICFQIIFLVYAFPSFSTNSSTDTEYSNEKRSIKRDVYKSVAESARRLIGAIDRGENLEQPLDDLMRDIEAIEAEDKEVHKRFQDIEEKVRASGSTKILSRHQMALADYDSKMRELMIYTGEVKTAVESNASLEAIRVRVKNLIEFIDKNRRETKVELRRAENRLPWRVVEPGEVLLLGDSSSIPQGEAPAALTSLPTGDELSATIDVQITPEIQELANSLGNRPLNIFRYVYNDYDYTPYYGSMKGSLDTFWEKEGNDYDLASLLIALLRASNIPARYVKAKIVITIENLMRWVDFNDPMSAIQYLSSAKIPIGYYVQGGKISHVQIEHVYVEAYIPYGNYRGTGEDDTGKAWIPMDPSFKQYQVTQEGVDIASQMGFDWRTFSDEYLGTLSNSTPIEYYKSKIDQYISQNYPGQTIDSLKRIIQISKMQFDFLPDTLPYVFSQVLERFSEIPQAQRHTLRFTGFLDYSTSLPEVSGRRITLAFDAATPDDQAMINEYGGIFKTPPYLVRVKPVLRVGGNKVVEGNGLNPGITLPFSIEYNQPGGKEIFDHSIITGSFNAVGITTGRVRPEYLNFEQVENTDESQMVKMLHNMAMKYHDEQNKTRQILNDTMKIKSRNLITEALVSTKENISSSILGFFPLSFGIDGFAIDAQEILTAIRSVDGRESKKGLDYMIDHMMVSGFEASYQENRVFEDTMFWLNGFSAIKGLQILKSMGVTIQEFEPYQSYYNPNLYDVVVEDINDALNMGWRVIVPENTAGLPVTPYIKYDPNTGSAGFMIASAAGGVSSFVRPITANLQLEEVLKDFLSEWTRHKNYGVAVYAVSPDSPYTLMLGDSFDLTLYFFIVVDGVFIGDRYGVMKIDTDKSHYDSGNIPIYALVPGEYPFKYYNKELFMMNVWGPMISPVMSDRYLGISTINNEDRIDIPLSIYYTVKQYPEMTLELATLKVYQGTNVIRTIPIDLGENLKKEWDGRNDGGQIVLPGDYEIAIESYAIINGEAKVKISDRHKVTVFKVEITTPITTEMNLTNIPTMPIITFNASVQPSTIRLSDITFKWYLEVKFHRDKQTADDVYRIPATATANIIGNSAWTPDWGSLIAGGDVTVTVSASIGGPVSTHAQIGYRIQGTQPTKSVVADRLGSNPLRAICCHESDFSQFNCMGDGCIAMPLPCYARDGGYGLMMPTWPIGATSEQVWNWTANVEFGIERHSANLMQSQNHLNNWNGTTPYPLLSPRPNPQITMTEEQHMLNAFSLYRYGTDYYGARRVGNTTVYELYRLSGTGPDYADEVRAEMNANTRCRY